MPSHGHPCPGPTLCIGWPDLGPLGERAVPAVPALWSCTGCPPGPGGGARGGKEEAGRAIPGAPWCRPRTTKKDIPSVDALRSGCPMLPPQGGICQCSRDTSTCPHYSLSWVCCQDHPKSCISLPNRPKTGKIGQNPPEWGALTARQDMGQNGVAIGAKRGGDRL